MTSNNHKLIGAKPENIRWQVVRGDTAELRIEFYQQDEKTSYSTSEWSYKASVYDSKADIIDELTVYPGNGYVDIVASPDITKNWGTGHGQILAELLFDVQVTQPNGVIWTPVLGTILVLGDVTYGGNL